MPQGLQFTPRPPVNLFLSEKQAVGTTPQEILRPPLYAKVDAREQVESLRDTTAVLLALQLVNTSGAARTVTFSVRSVRQFSYTAQVTAVAGQNWIRLDRRLPQAGAALTGYDWSETPPVRRSENIADTESFSAVVDTAWSPDSRYLAAAYGRPFFRLYDSTDDFSQVFSVSAVSAPTNTTSVAWDSTGRYLAVGYRLTALTSAPGVRVYDLDTIASPVEVTVPGSMLGDVPRITWGGPSGRYMIAVSNDAVAKLTVYDWNSGAPVLNGALSGALDVPGTVRDARWSPDGRYLAVAHTGGDRLTVFDWDTGAPVKMNTSVFASNTQSAPRQDSLAWSANSERLTCLSAADPQTPFTVYNFGASVTVLPAPAPLPPLPFLRGVAWSADGRYLCVGHTDAERFTFYPIELPFALLYDYNSGSPVRVLQNPRVTAPGRVITVSWAPDNSWLVIGGDPLSRFYPPTGVDNVKVLDGAGENQLQNGSFEDITGLTRESFGFSSVGGVPGWFIEGNPTATMFLPNRRFVEAFATDGAVYLDLTTQGGPPGAGSSVQLRQNIDGLTPGATYTISVDVTGSPESTIGLDVRWNGSLVSFGPAQTLPIVETRALASVVLQPGEVVTDPFPKAAFATGDTLLVEASGGGVDAVVSYVLNTLAPVETFTGPSSLPPDPDDPED